MMVIQVFKVKEVLKVQLAHQERWSAFFGHCQNYNFVINFRAVVVKEVRWVNLAYLEEMVL